MFDPSKYHFSSFSVIMVFFLLMITGLAVIPLLNVQLTPSRSLPRLSVSYNWPDASARIIEQEVSSKLEGMFNSVKGIKEISSVSYKGAGQISLSFKKDTNLDAARFEIASLIRQVHPELPPQVSFPQLSMGTSGQTLSPIMTYVINANASPFLIQRYAEDQLASQLSTLPGISSVKVYGASPFEWEIKYNSDRLQTLGISAHKISQGINTYFKKEFLGQGVLSDVQAKSNTITGLYLTHNKKDSINWQRIPVTKVKGRIIYLGDIATISYKEQTPNSYFRINGLNTINMVIYPTAGVNHLTLAKSIKAKTSHLEKKLPVGYSLLLSNDTTAYIQKELKKILLRTVFSLIILLSFVLVITRKPRYLLLIVFSILANLIIACIFYYLLKIEIHLYSLAGITISFGIIIDNSIIMIDHIRHQGNKRAFLAIFAATLTTIGALSMIFFLKESQQINLIEFAQVIIINLTVSMGIALFFIPALMDKISLQPHKQRFQFRKKKQVVIISHTYQKIISFNRRYRWIYLLLLILGFGIPVHWLPAKIEKECKWAQCYNETLGSSWFTEEAKPIIEKALGGSLRLFSEYVFESSFYSEPSRTMLHIRGKMPEGCTVQQLNQAVEKMENYLSQFEQIELFQTSIYAYNNSSIAISFKPEFEDSSFPYFLKEAISSKAISLGGLDWSVYGVGRGFSNALNTSFKNSRILLEGYNYDQLYRYAELLQAKLSQNERVKDIEITGSTNWNSSSLYEYSMDFNFKSFRLHETNIGQFYSFLKNKTYKENLTPVYTQNELQPVSLVADSYDSFNVWDLGNRPIQIDDKQLKMENFGKIVKQKSGNEIHKINQQYQLVVAYNFIGPDPLSRLVRERHEQQLKEMLPLGYSVKNSPQHWGWDKKDKKQYFLILVVILIIYFICAVLLESLLQPLAIILMIPISFIGVFLTFYFFDFNFDQGGFASFILLSGLVVNAGLYIINDYNNFKREKSLHPPQKLYLKAFNHKVIPIFLTIISTIFGLIPFVWSGQKEVFWFAFAVGAMGGMIFSVVAILFYLPLFIRKT